MRRVVGASFAYGVTADQFVCKLIKFDIMEYLEKQVTVTEANIRERMDEAIYERRKLRVLGKVLTFRMGYDAMKYIMNVFKAYEVVADFSSGNHNMIYRGFDIVPDGSLPEDVFVFGERKEVHIKINFTDPYNLMPGIEARWRADLENRDAREPVMMVVMPEGFPGLKFDEAINKICGSVMIPADVFKSSSIENYSSSRMAGATFNRMFKSHTETAKQIENEIVELEMYVGKDAAREAYNFIQNEAHSQTGKNSDYIIENLKNINLKLRTKQ